MLIVLRLFCKKPPAEVGGLSKGVISKDPQLAYMESLVQGCKGVVVYIDDILLTGTSGQEHLETLNQVLGILDKAGIRLKGR